MDKVTFSIIIPTLDRPKELLECVKSIQNQSVKPKEVIIIDDGDLSSSIQSRIRNYLVPDSQVIITSSSGPAGISTARNTGVKMASGTVVVLIDDDLVLGKHYLNRLRKLYSENDTDHLAGIGGFDSSMRTKSRVEQIFNLVFYQGKGDWKINRAGMQSWSSETNGITRSDWLEGNNASFKREVLLKHQYDHWNGGREALEDVAMGWKLKNDGYYCLIDPNLRLNHKEAEDTEGSFEYGYKLCNNRIRIFSKYGEKKYTLLFIWALIGDTLKRILAPIVDGDWQKHLKSFFGMVFAQIYFLYKSILK